MPNQMTDTVKLQILKHLAGGKPVDIVAAITHTTDTEVLDVAKNHGYPDRDKLSWAADILAKNIEKADQASISTTTTTAPRITLPKAPSVAVPAVSGNEPLTKPDEIRILLNTAKAHPSKRIQAAANRAFDALDRIRTLIKEDEEKHSAKRKADLEKAKARADIARLEEQLREAKARLRGKPAPQAVGGLSVAKSGQLEKSRAAANAALVSNTDLEPYGITSKDLRTWALDQPDLGCPPSGRLPRRILDTWLAAHPEAQAS